MANNYIQFSVMFPLANEEQATRAVEIADEPTEAHQDSEFGYDGFSVKADGSSLWIYADESGNPDGVIDYAVRLGREFKLTGLWGFTWAETCSKMRLDEFSGGAAVINLKSGRVEFTNAHSWLEKKLKQKKVAA